MEKYIKISELEELINNHKEQIDKEYKDGKISMTSHIAMIGTLEIFKKEIMSK